VQKAHATPSLSIEAIEAKELVHISTICELLQLTT